MFHGLCLNVLCMLHVSLLYKHDVGSYWFYMKFSGDFSEKEIFFKNQMKCYRAVFFAMNRWKIRISDKTFSKTYTVRMFIYIFFKQNYEFHKCDTLIMLNIWKLVIKMKKWTTRGVATLGSSRRVPAHNFHKILRKI